MISADSPTVATIIEELFAEADRPRCRIELTGTHGAETSRADVHWSVDGVEQPDFDLARTLTTCLHRLKLAALDEGVGLLHLHAGLVALDDRRAMIVGSSGAGKSTLVAALSRDGFAYGTDELVTVSDDGAVQPWRKPLGLKPGSLNGTAWVRSLRHPAFDAWPLDQAHLGLPSRWMTEDAVPVDLVVLPVRHAEPTPVIAVAIAPIAAIRLLATHSFDFTTVGALHALTAIAALVRSAPVVELHYHESHEVVSNVRALLDAPSTVVRAPPVAVAAPLDQPAAGRTQPRRAPESCGLGFDDGGLVAANDPTRVVELSATAWRVWSSADGSSTPSDRAVRSAVPAGDIERIDRELMDAGLLVV